MGPAPRRTLVLQEVTASAAASAHEVLLIPIISIMLLHF